MNRESAELPEVQSGRYEGVVVVNCNYEFGRCSCRNSTIVMIYQQIRKTLREMPIKTFLWSCSYYERTNTLAFVTYHMAVEYLQVRLVRIQYKQYSKI